jgi:hypothetical protein
VVFLPPRARGNWNFGMQGTKQSSLHVFFQSANTCMQTNIIPVETGSTDAGKQTTPPACIWPGQMQSGCLELAWEGYQTRSKVAPDANCSAICGLPVPICVVGRGCCNESFDVPGGVGIAWPS